MGLNWTENGEHFSAQKTPPLSVPYSTHPNCTLKGIGNIFRIAPISDWGEGRLPDFDYMVNTFEKGKRAYPFHISGYYICIPYTIDEVGERSLSRI